MGLRKNPTLEWHLCDAESEWVAAQSQPLANPVDTIEKQKGKGNRLLLWGAPSILVLVLILASGWWLSRQAHNGIVKVESEVANAVSSELWSARFTGNVTLQPWQEANFPAAIHGASDVHESVTQVDVRELGSDWATVEVWIRSNSAAQSYRQTRIYLSTEQGWLRVPASAEYWGAARVYESQYFTVHYRALDEEAVAQAAARLDVLYPALFASLFGEAPSVEKQQITVDPAQIPQALFYARSIPQKPLVVPSPAATLRPAEMAAGDLLLQSLMFALYQPLAEDAAVRHKLTEQWLTLFDGLRIWLIWEYDLSLAVWQKPLVSWIFREPNNNPEIERSQFVAFAEGLCLYHNLWMRAPTEVGIPVLCVKLHRLETIYINWQYHHALRGLSIAPLLYSSNRFRNDSGWADVPPIAPAYAPVVLATAFEYIATTYGRERIPALLEAIPAHQEAATLIPAVFGVSVADFDQGWQDFLVQHYDLKP